MARPDRRLNTLWRLLDESGLHWLADEVRAFPLADPSNDLNDQEVDALRAWNEAGASGVSPGERKASSANDRPIVPREFDVSVRYITQRIEDLAAYLEVSLTLIKELGLSGVRLGPEVDGEVDQLETAGHLRNLATTIREMEFS